MDIVLRVWEGFEELLVGLFEAVEKGQSFTEIELFVREKLNLIGAICLTWVVEKQDKHLREDVKARPDWVVVRKGDTKKVLTTFGEVEYKRTYYRNKKTGEYAHLADDAVRLAAHQRVSVGLKAVLVEQAAEVSYRKSGEWAGRGAKGGVLSASTVMSSEDAEELWLSVRDYIDERYDTSCLKRVFICGDGAAWVKKGLEVIPKSVFVLDLFHLDRYIVSAFGRDLRSQLWELLHNGSINDVQAWFKGIDVRWMSESQKQLVEACWRYISQNWYGITAYRLYPEARLGVSAEAHVSHVLSARLSSRPMAWSKKGADQMARLRAMQANGESLRQAYIEKFGARVRRVTASIPKLNEEREQLKRVVGEVFDNLPALRGSVTQLTRTLKAISRSVFEQL
ncbi:MAG TPA: ISLre2 family transposase [Firmicutes bacterium]|nr:ISLre2 family transposase [Bacillota bacterium]